MPSMPDLHASGRYGVEVPRYEDEDSLLDVVDRIGGNARTWQRLSFSNRISTLMQVKKRCILASASIGVAVQQIKVNGDERSRVDNGRAGYSGVAFSVVLCAYIDALITAMHVVQDGTRRTYCGVLRRTAAAEPVLRVEPDASATKPATVFPKVDLYTQPGKPPSRGAAWERAHAEARRGACVVLGAGNQPFLSAIDVLAKMFYDNYPVVLKHHDAQALVATHLEWVFQPLRDTGCYAGMHCDVPLTVKMMHHASVAAAHMTGSLNTHESICWGPPEGREERKARNEPALSVPMTSELGNVTPVVVVPGMWTAAQVDKVAAAVAWNMRDNAGCNCLAPRVVVLPAEWHLTERFEKAVKDALAAERFEPAWYPGTQSTWQRFYDEHSSVDIIKPVGFDAAKAAGKPAVPWAVASVTINDLSDAGKVPMFAREVFAPVLVVARVSTGAVSSSAGTGAAQQAAGSDARKAQRRAVRSLGTAFLRRAPELLNNHVWGNLVCSVYVDADTQAALLPEVQRAVDELQYGSVVVNRSTYQAYGASPGGMWGGYQGSDTSMANVGSGVGYINNCLLFDHPRKQALWFEFDCEPERAREVAVPLWMTKVLAGLLVNGASGLLTALWPF